MEFTEEEDQQMWHFLADNKTTLRATRLWQEFKEKSKSSRTTSCLNIRFKQVLAKRVHLADISVEDKVKIYQHYTIMVDPSFRENLVELGYNVDEHGYIADTEHAPESKQGRKRPSSNEGASLNKQTKIDEQSSSSNMRTRNTRNSSRAGPMTVIKIDYNQDAPQDSSSAPVIAPIAPPVIKSSPINPIAPIAPIASLEAPEPHVNLDAASIIDLIEKTTSEALERHRSICGSKQTSLKNILNSLKLMTNSTAHLTRINAKIEALGSNDKKVPLETVRSMLHTALNILDI